MKILMLNYEFPPIGAGAANAHQQLLTQFAQHPDLTVDVLTSAMPGSLLREKFSEKITIHKVPLHKKDLHYWRKIEVLEWLFKAKKIYRTLLAENTYDLVHAFFGFPSGRLCYKTANRLPYIISLRGSDVPGINVRLSLDYKILGPLFKKIWHNASNLIACSQGLKTRALRFMPAARIDVIPNGVDLDRFKPSPNKPSSKTLRLMTVGRLSATKRPQLLIDAIHLLKNQGRDVSLTIVGAGAMLKSLHQQVSQMNLVDHVDLKGRIEQDSMPTLYQQHDLFISATCQEGMSNAMLEAMASGLPIVTTPCEGAEELIVDNGIVVEEPTASAIAQAVAALTDDLAKTKTMAEAARNQAQQFSWKKIADRYLECYKEIIHPTNQI